MPGEQHRRHLVAHADVDGAGEALVEIMATLNRGASFNALSQGMLRPLPEGGFTLHYDPAIAMPFREVTEQSAAQGEAALWRLYDNIRAQTLITRGASSDLLAQETALAMTQRGPKARLVEFEGVGHAPMFVAADQVEAAVSFLLGPTP